MQWPRSGASVGVMTYAALLPTDTRFPLPPERPFTRDAALRTGLTDKRLRTLVRRGYLRRPIAGVYVASQVPDSLALRTEMLRLVLPPGCFACDETAAWLHGADMALAPNSHLVLPRVAFFRHADEGRLRNPLVRSGERTVAAGDLVSVGGLMLTSPLRTALDLGRLRHRDQALSALDAFLHLGLVTPEELLAGVARLARQRGVVQLRWLVAIADGRAESAGESALRLRWYDAGLPRPQLQSRCSATAWKSSGSTWASRSCCSPQSTTASTSTPRPSSAATTTVAAPRCASSSAGPWRSSTTPTSTGSTRTPRPGSAPRGWRLGPAWVSARSSCERPICADWAGSAGPSAPTRLLLGGEVQVDPPTTATADHVGAGVGPAGGDDLAAGVEVHALGAVGVGVAEQRGLPAAERVVGHRHRDRHVDADHPDLDLVLEARAPRRRRG